MTMIISGGEKDEDEKNYDFSYLTGFGYGVCRVYARFSMRTTS
jgi:hypothetical protein